MTADLQQADSGLAELELEVVSAQRTQSEQYSKLTRQIEYLERVHYSVPAKACMLCFCHCIARQGLVA